MDPPIAAVAVMNCRLDRLLIVLLPCSDLALVDIGLVEHSPWAVRDLLRIDHAEDEIRRAGTGDTDALSR
jgi:hypothetical protein